MPLTKLTITGADHNTDLDHITDLSCSFPFLEWGILLNRYEKQGTPKYPTRAWIDSLLVDKAESWIELFLSAHLCGPWVRKLGNNELYWSEINFLDKFDRIQINKSYHDSNDLEVIKLVKAISNIDRNVIFQNNGTLPRALVFETLGISPTVPEILFDCSGGRGIVIRDYPAPIDESEFFCKVFCGYAGGIGPDNIEQVINDINTKYPNLDYWLDMETMVRTDYKLDMKKVEQCATIAQKYVK